MQTSSCEDFVITDPRLRSSLRHAASPCEAQLVTQSLSCEAQLVSQSSSCEAHLVSQSSSCEALLVTQSLSCEAQAVLQKSAILTSPGSYQRKPRLRSQGLQADNTTTLSWGMRMEVLIF
jgi:hypothetical protein